MASTCSQGPEGQEPETLQRRAEAGGHSPVQQGQQGKPLVAHRGPTARQKPVLVAVLGTGRCLLHQRLLLGFVQGVLVQQVKLRSPQPRPSAPRPQHGPSPRPPPPAHAGCLAIFSSTERPLHLALGPSIYKGLLLPLGSQGAVQWLLRTAGAAGGQLQAPTSCLFSPGLSEIYCVFQGLNLPSSWTGAIRVTLTTTWSTQRTRPGCNASALRPQVKYLTSLRFSCSLFNKNSWDTTMGLPP